MKVLIFKTDAHHPWHVGHLSLVLNPMEIVHSWTLDRDDIDNVLRIISTENTNEEYISNLLQNNGFECEPLN